MIRTWLLVAGLVFPSLGLAEFMKCDENRRCSFICYFPSASAHTGRVYSDYDSVAVDRVRVELLGDDNLLYTIEWADHGSSAAPTFRALETIVLPDDYPCRLSPDSRLDKGLQTDAPE